MNDYTCKIPRSNCVFVGSESAGASSDRLIDVISPLAAGYPSRSSMRNDYRVLDLVGRSSNAERPNGSYRIRREFKSGEFLVRTTENFRASQSFPWYREPQYPTRDSSKHPANRVPKIAESACRRDLVAVRRTEILSRLLEPICPAAWGGHPVLWPLWADEMVHRTYATIQLTSLVLSQWGREHRAPVRWQLDYRVASNRMPCAALLRGLTRNFVELFGPVAGDITIATRIEPLQLVAIKRCALGAVAIELLSDALLHAFVGGKRDVSKFSSRRFRGHLLGLSSRTTAGRPARTPQVCQHIGRDLANLLETGIAYGMPEFVAYSLYIGLPYETCSGSSRDGG
jgi:hypothetical protein